MKPIIPFLLLTGVLLFCGTARVHADTFLINGGESSTGTTTVQITLEPDNPANIENVFIGNTETDLVHIDTPVYAPLTFSWSLSPSQGSKTVYVFFDFLGGGWFIATQTIFFSPIVNCIAASSALDAYPHATPLEYNGQESLGTGRWATTTPGIGHALQLKR